MSRTSGVLTVFCLWLCLPAPPALAGTLVNRVHLVDGRYLDASTVRTEGQQSILTLAGGGTVAFPSSRVTKVEMVTLADPPAAPPRIPPSPAPDAPAAASPAAPPAAAAPRTAPVPKEPTIEELVQQAADRYRLEVDLLAAVIAVESGYRADAISPKGAQGLMQLMPATARDLSVTDPFDPAQNIDAGARYLRKLLDEHGDSYVRALAAYNAGAGRVARYRGIPPYRETITYIRKVLKRYASPEPVPSVAPPGVPGRHGR